MGLIEKKLEQLGLHLPIAKPPVGNYLGSKKDGGLLFASARVSDCRGKVGAEVSVEQAIEAARETVLSILAIVKKDINDLHLISGVVKLTGFINSAPNFTQQPKVLDGASDLLIDLFGEEGRHARTATGVDGVRIDARVARVIVRVEAGVGELSWISRVRRHVHSTERQAGVESTSPRCRHRGRRYAVLPIPTPESIERGTLPLLEARSARGDRRSGRSREDR